MILSSQLGPEQRRQPNRLPRNHQLPALYRFLEEDSSSQTQDLQIRDAKLAKLEAALFLAEEPITARKLVTVAELNDQAEVRRGIQKLQELYEADGTAFQIEEIAGGYQLRTRPLYHPWLIRYVGSTQQIRLSPAAMETLAIVAYRQPIMRAEIETIRGVQSGDILSQLIEKGLIRISGRHDSLGRPVLYGTTKKFLEMFGLNHLNELPKLERGS